MLKYERVAVWRLQHPLWLCAFRPFFALAMIFAWFLMLIWGVFLNWGWPVPAVTGGPFVWHVHELFLGFALAALAGFVLTSVPEFTNSASFTARPLRLLVLLWLLARLAFWSSAWFGSLAFLLSGLLHVSLILALLWLVWPRLYQDPGRRHLSFAWVLALLAAATLVFYFQAFRGAQFLPLLQLLLGVLMILIIVAMSRISMSIVNASIDDYNARHPDDQREPYLARPARRNLAFIAIGLHTVVQYFQPASDTTAWVALAAACAILNLLNDWHVGKPLWRRWPLLLYAVYVFMAAGYALMGLAVLTGHASPHGGIHLLTVGALGLSIYAVICIAGYTHSGLEKSGRPWIWLGASLLICAAVMRASAYFLWPHALMLAAVVLWCIAFLLMTGKMLPVFLSPRGDGAAGCAEPPAASGGENCRI